MTTSGDLPRLQRQRWRYFVTAGALMSYGIDNIDVLQKAAYPMSIDSCAG
jgi:hypothetical protein